MSRIVIGYEATPEGLDALRLGRLFGEAFGAEALVATVLPFPSYLIPPERVEAALEAEPFRLFDRPNSELAGVAVKTRVVTDPSPAQALQLLAEENEADLIVVGACHRGALGRVLLGSVGESMVDNAPCPVAFAPRGYSPEPEDEPGVVGIAFDGSPEAVSALALASRFAARFDARLEVMAVAELPHLEGPASYSWMPGAEDRDVERREKEALIAEALRQVPPGMRATGRLLEGRAGHALAEAAAGVDLLVAGSRGYGPLRRVVLGSVTRAITRRAPCPVVITPRGVLRSFGLDLDAARADTVNASGT